MGEVVLKTCSKCKQEKPSSEYNKDRRKQDGLRCECRSCQAKQTVIDCEKRRQRLRHHKFQAIYSGLTAVSKKIYDATPINEAWSANQINSELARTSTPVEFKTILGCLNGLVDAGLVKESPNGCFQRVRIISKPERSIEKDSAENASLDDSQSQASRVIGMQQTISKEKIIIDPIEKIGQLAMQCREIMDAVQRLASDIETVAIEVQENFSSRDAEVQKLKQLQQLLKSLG